MYNDLESYLEYSQNQYYDLSKGLYTAVDLSNGNTPATEITDGVTPITLTNGVSTGLVNLHNYYLSSNQNAELYTYDYIELSKVYLARQEEASSSGSGNDLAFTLNKICFDINVKSGDGDYTNIESYTNVDLSSFSYFVNDISLTTFYDNAGNDINSNYNLKNGLFDENGHKICRIFDVTYTYNLVYEENQIINITKEETN